MLNTFIVTGKFSALEGTSLFIITKDHDTDYRVRIYLSEHFVDTVNKYCHEGDIIGVKGHLEVESLVADKLTLLSKK